MVLFYISVRLKAHFNLKSFLICRYMIEAEGLFPDSLVIDRVALEKAHIINAKLLKNSQSRGNNTKYIINSAK